MDHPNENPFMLAENGRMRAMALFRVLCFAVLLAAPFLAAVLVLRHTLATLHSFENLALAGEMIAALCALFATVVMARATGKKFGMFGFGARGWPRNFLLGIVVGIALLAAQLLAMSALGVFSFGTVTASGTSLLYYGLFYALLFLTVGVAEETMWRGYALVEASRAISFWPAALVLSAIFGALHLLNGGENHAGALVAFLFGIVLAFSFQQTGSLWLALGLHSGWDYAESFLFGVPDSGVVLTGRLLHPVVHGPAWLTGGGVGPEGSVLVAAPLLAIMLLSRLLRRRSNGAAASSPPSEVYGVKILR